MDASLNNSRPYLCRHLYKSTNFLYALPFAKRLFQKICQVYPVTLSTAQALGCCFQQATVDG
jgi:hypothetical protein